MNSKSPVATVHESDEGYYRFERMIRDRVAQATGPVFTIDVDPAHLWETYLQNLPSTRRQHYNCSCCRKFIEKYGGLVTIDNEGHVDSLLWEIKPQDRPTFFADSIAILRVAVERAEVTGVFLSSETVWGTPRTGDWTHLSGIPGMVCQSWVKTPGQLMAEKKEDYGILSHGLADYPLPLVEQAVRVLTADALTRSEKAKGIADWFLTLHKQVQGIKGPRRKNILWYAVATTPPGFCHIRSTMISTLLDDIKAGLKFEVISRRWAEKMNPLQYQRPTAPPTEGTIKQAEDLVRKLGVERSLLRRFARIEDVIELNPVFIAGDNHAPIGMWMPSEPKRVAEEAIRKGVFDHLRKSPKKVNELELPAVRINWEKFQRTVLPQAYSIDLFTPSGAAPFYGLVTAVDPEAPPILQWDGLPGHLRNPVSWYFYNGGSPAESWNLTRGAWANVNAVFLPPFCWQEPDKFTHHGEKVLFALDGAIDTRATNAGIGLFPEILKAEFHGIRSVIEAHSRTGSLQNPELGTANGIALHKTTGRQAVLEVTLRVQGVSGTQTYILDRWD